MVKAGKNFKLLEHDQEIELKMNPTSEKKSLLDRLLPVKYTKTKDCFSVRKDTGYFCLDVCA